MHLFHLDYVSHFFVIFFLKERESERAQADEKGQRERERESQTGSTLSTEPDAGLDLTTMKSSPKPKSRVRCSND